MSGSKNKALHNIPAKVSGKNFFGNLTSKIPKSLIVIPMAVSIFFLYTTGINSKTSPKRSKIETVSPSSLSALEIQNTSKKIWDSVCARYPSAVWAWKNGRAKDGLSTKFEVEVTHNAPFMLIEDEGRSVKIDDFSKIYVNMDRPFLAPELIEKICESLFHYGYSTNQMPFDDLSVRKIIPYIAASDIYEKKFSGLRIIADDNDMVVFFFASIVGVQDFVDAYSHKDESKLRSAYDSLFGKGAYNSLLTSENKFSEITGQAKRIGKFGSIRTDMTKIAEKAGYATLKQW
ncbi:MAG: hypothetical protein WC492_03670 [Candidatus Micrarchaeia archaeon]